MRSSVIVIVAVVALLTGVVASAQSVEGAWERSEVVVKGGPNAGTNSSPQASLLIFAKSHYSHMYVRGDEPRKLHADRGPDYSPTDEEMIASYGSFVANSGTYEISGSKITFKPMVAKNPNFMSGGSASSELKVEGNSLWLTSTRTAGGEDIVTVAKYTRLE